MMASQVFLLAEATSLVLLGPVGGLVIQMLLLLVVMMFTSTPQASHVMHWRFIASIPILILGTLRMRILVAV